MVTRMCHHFYFQDLCFYPTVSEWRPGLPTDVKQAPGMNRDDGHSPNEAATDQRVEDAKRERHNTRH